MMYILNPSLFMQPTKKFSLVENNNSGEMFDPTITTSVSATLIWSSSDGYSTVTTGTTHNVSYTAPANGPRKWTITCVAGLGAIKTLDMNTDKLVSIDISLLRLLTNVRIYTNPSLSMQLRDLPRNCVSLYSDGCLLITGDLVDFPRDIIVLSCGSFPLVTGNLADIPRSAAGIYIVDSPLITGYLNGIPAGATLLYLCGDYSVGAASVSHLVSIQDLRIYDMQWSSASVNTVLLSISDAIHADVNHFTYANPFLQIGGSNLAPGGNYVAPPTEPNQSNDDWEWDSTKSKYKAISGKAAIWVMVHNTGHVWTVTATGGTYT